MSVVFLVYTIGARDVDKIRVAKGIDQRFGRLDIIARIIDVLSDEAFRDLSKHIIVYIKSIEIVIHIDVDMISGRGFYKEVDLYNILLQCVNRDTSFCSRIVVDFELLLEMLQARYEVVVLTEEGERISPGSIAGNTVYIVGAEEDPPKDIVARYKRISIGPLAYQADQVVGYLMWIIKRRLSGPIPA
ncbi:MAG: hypothetical protein N3D82_05320 [Ignisphaera sp.]|nr:hypothetical protein [Ignisphaera sp.]MCX8168427.1 hypothetical protein [Ignisphaera sp.]MDW8086060.1 hypothetical protein [Ignisphaera sp.]